MTKLSRTLQGLTLLAVLTAGACATPRGRVYVRIGPPRPVVERRLVAPGPGYVWIPGFYRWDGARYIWFAGRWERPPRPRMRWVPGRWVRTRAGWYYVEGHWR